jgi:hypothetical protein
MTGFAMKREMVKSRQARREFEDMPVTEMTVGQLRELIQTEVAKAIAQDRQAQSEKSWGRPPFMIGP